MSYSGKVTLDMTEEECSSWAADILRAISARKVQSIPFERGDLRDHANINIRSFTCKLMTSEVEQ